MSWPFNIPNFHGQVIEATSINADMISTHFLRATFLAACLSWNLSAQAEETGFECLFSGKDIR